MTIPEAQKRSARIPDNQQLTTASRHHPEFWRTSGAMRAFRGIALSLVLLTTFAVAQKSDFAWDWRDQQVIGREDASVGNTSKLTEPERSSLLDAIVLRLQKPMADAGYDDDRIREIASTTRIRFIDTGASEPLIFTTSLGLEGGCDGLGNCPLWVFRRTDEGFLSLLNTIAASYTPRMNDGAWEVIFMHHMSSKESGLTEYRLEDGALHGIGCFIAVWPKASDDPTQISDPKLEPCKVQPALAEPAPQGKQSLPLPPLPAATEPSSQTPATEQPEAQPKSETAAPNEPPPTTTEPVPETPKAEQVQPAAPIPARKRRKQISLRALPISRRRNRLRRRSRKRRSQISHQRSSRRLPSIHSRKRRSAIKHNQDRSRRLSNQPPTRNKSRRSPTRRNQNLRPSRRSPTSRHPIQRRTRRNPTQRSPSSPLLNRRPRMPASRLPRTTLPSRPPSRISPRPVRISPHSPLRRPIPNPRHHRCPIRSKPQSPAAHLISYRLCPRFAFFWLTWGFRVAGMTGS